MTDLGLSTIALLVLAAGIGACALLHRLGLASTYARDLLHVGAGVWVLGWPLFHGLGAPLAIVCFAALATQSVPFLSRSIPMVARLRDTFAGGDERWSGLSLYTLSYALFTWVGLAHAAFPAAAALFALSLGDGIGGFVGRRFGTRRFRVPGGKHKSVEGSLTVALFATVGVFLAAWRFGESISLPAAAGLGVGAALGEAVAPRGTDNVVVPALVFCLTEVSS
jgi:dolichol kinase